MKVYGISNLGILFSTRDRAEQFLRDDELGDKDGYFIEESEVSDEKYFELLAHEAREDEAEDDFLLGR